mgnify:CR=1 FL=1
MSTDAPSPLATPSDSITEVAAHATELALPSPEEQQEIADVLDAVGNKTEIAERKRDQLQDLFRTLLHELMTAKTRVHELEREKEEVA